MSTGPAIFQTTTPSGIFAWEGPHLNELVLAYPPSFDGSLQHIPDSYRSLIVEGHDVRLQKVTVSNPNLGVVFRAQMARKHDPHMSKIGEVHTWTHNGEPVPSKAVQYGLVYDFVERTLGATGLIMLVDAQTYF